MKSKRSNSTLVKVIVSAMIVGLIALSLIVFELYQKVCKANIKFGDNIEERYIFIDSDDEFLDVVSKLTSYNLLLDLNSFKWVAEKKNYIKNIKPGKYFINKEMNNNELINLLRSGRQSPVKVTFNNVRSLNGVASKLSSYLEADSSEILEAFLDDKFLEKNNFNKYNIISIFIPNTYEFYWNTSSIRLRDRMLKEYKLFWNKSRTIKASEINLSLQDVSILASIVQKEQNIRKDERPSIAGLYLNRLKKGMKLESDPTLIFALKDFNINRVLNKDKRVDSPYNTYKHVGLPPGPICIPSINSIDAVLNAEEHDYIFMCAKEDFSGYHNFAKNYARHLINARKYQKTLNKRRILR